MMEKHISIIRLLEHLKFIIDFTNIDVVDYWEADLCAIGLKKGNRLIYISTFNYLASVEEPRFDFDLEVMNGSESEKLKVVKKGRNVLEAELVTEMKAFFRSSK